MEHETAKDFTVTPGVDNQYASYLAETIKRLEPIVRTAGRALSFDKLRSARLPHNDEDINLDDFCV